MRKGKKYVRDLSHHGVIMAEYLRFFVVVVVHVTEDCSHTKLDPRFNVIVLRLMQRLSVEVMEWHMPWNCMHDLSHGLGAFFQWGELESEKNLIWKGMNEEDCFCDIVITNILDSGMLDATSYIVRNWNIHFLFCMIFMRHLMTFQNMTHCNDNWEPKVRHFIIVIISTGIPRHYDHMVGINENAKMGRFINACIAYNEDNSIVRIKLRICCWTENAYFGSDVWSLRALNGWAIVSMTDSGGGTWFHSSNPISCSWCKKTNNHEWQHWKEL